MSQLQPERPTLRTFAAQLQVKCNHSVCSVVELVEDVLDGAVTLGALRGSIVSEEEKLLRLEGGSCAQEDISLAARHSATSIFRTILARLAQVGTDLSGQRVNPYGDSYKISRRDTQLAVSFSNNLSQPFYFSITKV